MESYTSTLSVLTTWTKSSFSGDIMMETSNDFAFHGRPCCSPGILISTNTEWNGKIVRIGWNGKIVVEFSKNHSQYLAIFR